MSNIPCLFLTHCQKQALDDSCVNLSFLSLNNLKDYFSIVDLTRIRELTNRLLTDNNILVKLGFGDISFTNNDIETQKKYNESTLLHAEHCVDFILIWPDEEQFSENVNNNMLANIRAILSAIQGILPYSEVIKTNQFKTFFSLTIN